MKKSQIFFGWLIVVCGLILCFASRATAQTTAALPDVLTLETAAERVTARNLTVESARLQISAAETERVAARLRPRPILNVSAENLKIAGGNTSFGNLYEVGATVSQPIELGNQRAARLAVAENSVSVAEANLANAIRLRLSEMRRAFYEVLAAEARLRIEIENQTNFGELVRFNTVRLKEGEVSEGELIKVRLERIKYDSAVANARLEVGQAKIRFLALLGETDFAAAERIELQGAFELREFAVDLATLKQTATENRPEIKIAEAELRRAEAVLRLEQARGRGDIVPFGGYRQVGGASTAVVGVSIPLPFGNRNQGAIARAEAEGRIAANILLQIKNRTAAEVETAFLAFETAREQVRAFETGVLRQADESREITLIAYREGATELLNVLEAQRTRAEVRNNYYAALLNFYQNLFELEAVTGVELRK